MIPAEVIKLKRSGKELDAVTIKEFVDGFVSGAVTDYQMSAFLMAVFFRGMTQKETWALTESMLHSGSVVDFSESPGAKIDKHSTGGVGDKTSLIVGPIAAAAGVKVPMISGRGLGHTGGTLDKLESIPGFRTQLSLDEFAAQVEKIGLCFIGQTAEICPADKRMYALRDVTGTVECIPLICASIMSKKLAEGIDGLVLDIKVGTGAFMKTLPEARELAKGLLRIGESGRKNVTALITDMNQPLGCSVGNALEVQECLSVLAGDGPSDLRALSLELAAHMILLGAKSKNIETARVRAREILDSGAAKQKFEQVVAAQGGRLELPEARNTKTVSSPRAGYVSSMDVEKIGLASLALGAGRLRTADAIDPAAGMIVHKKLGDKVVKGEPLATLYYSDGRDYQTASEMLGAAIQIRLQKIKAPRLIKLTMKTRKPR